MSQLEGERRSSLVSERAAKRPTNRPPALRNLKELGSTGRGPSLGPRSYRKPSRLSSLVGRTAANRPDAGSEPRDIHAANGRQTNTIARYTLSLVLKQNRQFDDRRRI